MTRCFYGILQSNVNLNFAFDVIQLDANKVKAIQLSEN